MAGIPPDWRPFFRESIDELEDIVRHQQGNHTTLMMVRAELDNRATARARTLAIRIDQLMGSDAIVDLARQLQAGQGQLSTGYGAAPAQVRQLGAGTAAPVQSREGTRQIGHGATSGAEFPTPSGPAGDASGSIWKRLPEWAKFCIAAAVLLGLYHWLTR